MNSSRNAQLSAGGLNISLCADFKDLRISDSALAGGKGASLGELTHAGIPVPPGFVVTAPAFDAFLARNGLATAIDATLRNVNHNSVESLDLASLTIRNLIENSPMDPALVAEIRVNSERLASPFVAVRSSASCEDSADASWAGQLDSHVFVRNGDTVTKVKQVWSSLFTSRAMKYRLQKGLRHRYISVGVVIQHQVDSYASGVAFTANPVTNSLEEMLIEATYGQGEALVSGMITPDNYLVLKKTLTIKEFNVQNKSRALKRDSSGGTRWRAIPEPMASSPALSKEQCIRLSSILLNIEQHYRHHCDVEFATDKRGHIFIVQSRPITTLVINN